MQSANIGAKCVTFVSDPFTRYGSNITNVWQEIFMPMTLAFSCEVVHEKNMKIRQNFISYSKTISGTFFLDTVYMLIRSSANRITGLVRRNFKNIDFPGFLLLYKSMIRSHLEYAQTVWSPHKVKLIKALEKVQNVLLKFFLDSDICHAISDFRNFIYLLWCTGEQEET